LLDFLEADYSVKAFGLSVTALEEVFIRMRKKMAESRLQRIWTEQNSEEDLDSKYHITPDDKNGPVESTLLPFGPVVVAYEGTALGLGIGCFGKFSAGFNGVCTFIARNCAVSYVGRYDDKSPKEALGMFRSRNRLVRGHATVFAWIDLILDRSRKLAGLPAVTRRLRHACGWRLHS